MYKHRVDYYDYTTVFYSIYTCNKLHIETVTFTCRKSYIGRGVHASGKRMSGKVHVSGQVHTSGKQTSGEIHASGNARRKQDVRRERG